MGAHLLRFPRRVLVVEAHEDTRNLHVEHLQACGFTVTASWRLDDGIRLAAAADAIVTGLCIERLFDGFEFIAAVRAAEKQPGHTPIIVVTAHAQAAIRQQATAAGADIFFTKPCSPDVLAAAVSQATQQDASSSGDQRAS